MVSISIPTISAVEGAVEGAVLLLRMEGAAVIIPTAEGAVEGVAVRTAPATTQVPVPAVAAKLVMATLIAARATLLTLIATLIVVHVCQIAPFSENSRRAAL